MSLTAMVDRKLSSPYGCDAVIHTEVATEGRDVHGEPETDTVDTPARCAIFPTQTSESSDLGTGRYQAFFYPDAPLTALSWVTVGDDRYDLTGPPMRWPTATSCVYQEATLARTS